MEEIYLRNGKENLLLINPDGLVGDFLGTIPVMIDLSKEYNLYVNIHPEAEGLFNLIPKKYGIKRHQDETALIDYRMTLDIQQAFQDSSRNKWYMSQAYHSQVGLETPQTPPKAELEYEQEDLYPHVYEIDYYISPYARSLPPNQKLCFSKWNYIVKNNPLIRFGVLGNSKYDEMYRIQGDNVTQVFDTPFSSLCKQLLKSKGLISVVTGTSHLAFHLGLKNILLTNQNMTWGNNPDAIRITNPIDTLKVKEIEQYLNN